MALLGGWSRGEWSSGAWNAAIPVLLAGVASTAAVGSTTVNAVQNVSISVTSPTAVASVGSTVASIPVIVVASGVSAVAETKSVLVWSTITPAQSPSWSESSPAQDPTWTEKVPTQSPTWV